MMLNVCLNSLQNSLTHVNKKKRKTTERRNKRVKFETKFILLLREKKDPKWKLTIRILSNAQSHFWRPDIVLVLLICLTNLGRCSWDGDSFRSSCPWAFSRSPAKETCLFFSSSLDGGGCPAIGCWAGCFGCCCCCCWGAFVATVCAALPSKEPPKLVMPPRRFLAASPAALAASWAALMSWSITSFGASCWSATSCCSSNDSEAITSSISAAE